MSIYTDPDQLARTSKVQPAILQSYRCGFEVVKLSWSSEECTTQYLQVEIRWNPHFPAEIHILMVKSHVWSLWVFNSRLPVRYSWSDPDFCFMSTHRQFRHFTLREVKITTWGWVNTYRYIFSGMNIHLSAVLGFTRGIGFWAHPHFPLRSLNPSGFAARCERPWFRRSQPSLGPLGHLAWLGHPLGDMSIMMGIYRDFIGMYRDL